MTDSELVPRGKGEKHPVEGSERVPEIVCLQAAGGLWLFGAMSDCVPLAWAGELLVSSKVKPLRWSRSESESEVGDQFEAVDPKPVDLPMARMKRR